MVTELDRDHDSCSELGCRSVSEPADSDATAIIIIQRYHDA